MQARKSVEFSFRRWASLSFPQQFPKTRRCQTHSQVLAASSPVKFSLVRFISTAHLRCASTIPLRRLAGAAQLVRAGRRRRRNPSPRPAMTQPHLRVLRQRCKTLCRSSLLFFSGCLYSSGLQRGMEGIMTDLTRDLDLEDDLVRFYDSTSCSQSNQDPSSSMEP